MHDFNKIIQGVAACFSCKVLGTSGCRLLKQYEAKDSSFSIPISDDGEFLRDRVYTVDIAFASEQEELELSDETEATVYRSMVDAEYELPDEALRLIFDEIVQKFPKFPFCVRNIGLCTTWYTGAIPYSSPEIRTLCSYDHMRFTLLVRALKTSSITETPQQVLHPMVPVELHGGIDLLWAKYKGRGKAQTKLSYCGRLPVGEESCGFKPYVSDVSWNKVARSWRDASDALACTGSFGTYIYLRSKSITIRLNENIEDGWEKVAIQNIPGKFCKWSPCGVYLAVGLVTDAGIPEVYIFHWEAAEIISRRIYVGNANFCLSLNPISWSHDSRFIVAPSRRTHHIPVVKVEKIKGHVHTVRFSENNQIFDYLCAAFHPRLLLFIAASTTGRFKLYELDRSKRVANSNKADVWIEDGKEWYDDDDNIGTRDLSFSTMKGDRLACARSDWSVKIWKFQHCPNEHRTSISPLFIIHNAGLEDLTVEWTRVEIDFLAVGDGKQIISIYGNNHTIFGNDYNADLAAHFKEATSTEWHPKSSLLASGGHDGFVLFWFLQTPPFEFFLAPKQRNIHVENMFYTHKPLPRGAASIALQAFEKTQATMLGLLNNAIDESDIKDAQLDEIAVLANSGLSKIIEGGASADELADYFREILRLSTKKPR